MGHALRVLIYDASPAHGGAVSSVEALSHELGRAGHVPMVVARRPELFACCAAVAVVLGLVADDLGAIHGLAYFVREARRAKQLHDLLQITRADVLLCNNAPTTNAAGALAARSARRPFLQYVRAPLPASPMTRRLLSMSHQVLSVGREVSSQCRRLGRDPLQVGEALSENQVPTSISAHADGFFWCASLAWWKGLSLAIDAYSEASSHCAMPPLDACFAEFPSGHPEASALPTRVPRGVRFFERPAELDRLRACRHIFVHSALSPEPYGRSILEAAHAGLCPIVPSHSTADGLVVHGRTGLTYQGGSLHELSAAMRFLVREPEQARAMGRAAREAAKRIVARETYAPVVHALEQANDFRTASSSYH